MSAENLDELEKQLHMMRPLYPIEQHEMLKVFLFLIYKLIQINLDWKNWNKKEFVSEFWLFSISQKKKVYLHFFLILNFLKVVRNHQKTIFKKYFHETLFFIFWIFFIFNYEFQLKKIDFIWK